jgi:uncharacterized protein (DUF983 family)
MDKEENQKEYKIIGISIGPIDNLEDFPIVFALLFIGIPCLLMFILSYPHWTLTEFIVAGIALVIMALIIKYNIY